MKSSYLIYFFIQGRFWKTSEVVKITHLNIFCEFKSVSFLPKPTTKQKIQNWNEETQIFWLTWTGGGGLFCFGVLFCWVFVVVFFFDLPQQFPELVTFSSQRNTITFPNFHEFLGKRKWFSWTLAVKAGNLFSICSYAIYAKYACVSQCSPFWQSNLSEMSLGRNRWDNFMQSHVLS